MARKERIGNPVPILTIPTHTMRPSAKRGAEDPSFYFAREEGIIQEQSPILVDRLTSHARSWNGLSVFTGGEATEGMR
jgi:hypothetical protein